MSAVIEAVREQGVVAIVRAPSAELAAKHVDTLITAGLRAIEVSLVTPQAIEVVRAAAARAPEGVMIGVGTVLSADDVRQAAEAGARFVVSPVAREDVIRASLEAGIDVFPGVATPTEALAAVRWGATLVKLFPATLWSPAVLREVLTALPWLQTIPTGGVTLQSAPEWISAGATAVGVGGALTRAVDARTTTGELLVEITNARHHPAQLPARTSEPLA